MPPAAARAVEIRLPIEDPDADRTLCLIFILPPGTRAAEPIHERLRAASQRHDDRWADTTGDRSQLGPPDDEEPTWEDAAWQ